MHWRWSSSASTRFYASDRFSYEIPMTPPLRSSRFFMAVCPFIDRARISFKKSDSCIAPIRRGAGERAQVPAHVRRLTFMSNFWMALLAAQTAAADTKPADRRHRVLSVLAGIALALLIGAGLFIAAALNL